MQLISIITVTKNSADTISDTFEVIKKIKNNFSDVEYIVIDGDSTDGTLEIINSYKNYIDVLVSEKDTGIYNAMNKGLNLATGAYISFLNADDQYIIENFGEFYQLMEVGNYDYIYGNILRDETGRKVLSKPMSENRAKKYGFIAPTLTQPASFIRKNVYEEIGDFDEQFKIAGDTDFLVRMLLSNNYKGKYLDKPVNIFNTKGISNKLSNFREHRIIKEKYSISSFKFYRYILESGIKRFIYRIINK